MAITSASSFNAKQMPLTARLQTVQDIMERLISIDKGGPDLTNDLLERLGNLRLHSSEDRSVPSAVSLVSSVSSYLSTSSSYEPGKGETVVVDKSHTDAPVMRPKP